MSPDPRLRVASQAAESWLNTVSLVAEFGQAGNVAMAYQMLLPSESQRRDLQTDYLEHFVTLTQQTEQLAAVSDGPVIWEHGRGWSAIAHVPSAVYPHRWSSAHEAAVGIAGLALDMLASPLAGITDPAQQWAIGEQLLAGRAKALVMTMEEVAALQERIRRERGKVLWLASPIAPVAPTPTPTAEQMSPVGKALAILATVKQTGHRCMLKDLANAAGVDRSTLTRNRHFKAAWMAYNKARMGDRPPTGDKNNGDIEAWDDEE